MATKERKPRRLKNIFTDVMLMDATRDTIYWYPKPNGKRTPLRIGGAYAKLGLDKQGHVKTPPSKGYVSGFRYIPSLRVAGTPEDFRVFMENLEANEDNSFAEVGGSATALSKVLDPTREVYTSETVRAGGVLRVKFEAEIEASRGHGGAKKAKMSSGEAAIFFNELVAARKQTGDNKQFKFELVKAPRAEAKGKSKRTGTRKGRAPETSSLGLGLGLGLAPAPALAPALGGLPSPGALSLPPGTALGATSLGGMPGAGFSLAGLSSPRGL